ncbi:MAG: aminoacyl-tRNA hydrolase [Desulfobacteraceae bacterium]
MYLIAGLGNPGRGYKNTRHNIGFTVINLWAERLGVRLRSRRFQSRNANAKFEGREIILLRPLTFMNQSGKSIKACLDVYQLKAENLLVIHDDIDLPVGRVKVVRNGGSGGHKGVTSIIEHLGTREFSRVKVGIGRPRYGETVERYVLSPFYRDDKEIIEEVIEMSVRACELFVSEGVVAAMNHINWENMADKEVMY